MLLPGKTIIEKVEFLPVIIYPNALDNLLGVPKLVSRSKEHIAAVIHNLLAKNHLLEIILAIDCDTIATNSDKVTGTYFC